MLNNTLPSIEEFAAFLDGNLTKTEMLQFSQFATHDGVLSQLLNANAVVDEALNGLTDANLQLPPDLMDLDFELPTIPTASESLLVSLSPEPTDDLLVVECANDDVSTFSDMNQDDHTIMEKDTQGDSSLMMSDNEACDKNDDLSGSLSDNIY